MRRQRGIAFGLVLMLGTLAAAGCGGGSKTATVATPSSSSHRQAVPAKSSPARARLIAALRKLEGEPHRETDRTRIQVVATHAPVQVQRALAGRSATNQVVTQEIESPRRGAGSATLPQLGGKLDLVIYDGSVFVSRDRRRWARVTGDLATVFGQALSVASQNRLASSLVGVRGAGRTTVAGARADRYAAQINLQSGVAALRQVFERLGIDLSAAHFEPGVASFVVRSGDGQLVSTRLAVQASLDLSKLPGGASGTVMFRYEITTRYSDQGAAIRVRRPTPSVTVSTPAAFAAFVGTAPARG